MSGTGAMLHKAGGHILAALCGCAAFLAIGTVQVFAEGDSPFITNSSQDFDTNYARYKTNNTSTNFASEVLPLGPLRQDGGLKFEPRSFDRSGKGANDYERGRTSIQLDFKF
jgi:hypothetical protein